MRRKEWCLVNQHLLCPVPFTVLSALLVLTPRPTALQPQEPRKATQLVESGTSCF